MKKSKKKIVYFLVVFIILISTGITLDYPHELKEMNNPVNDDNFKNDPSFLNTNQALIFLVGTGAGPHTIDPVNSWDSASNDVINQVCEGLFAYNYSDINMPRVNRLAEDHEWVDETHFRIKAREGVTFHDGFPFNASAIKWNLDRINYLTNSTGELPYGMAIAEPASLYWLPNGTGIMTKVTIESEYWVEIELHSPYAPFLDLLCYSASSMISPYSHDNETYIELYEDLIGTGPFKYDFFISNVEVRFSRWDNYWRTPVVFDEMVYVIIHDSVTRNDAMLNHEIDFLNGIIASYIPSFEADPSITVKHFTDDTGKPGLSYYYLGMNNLKINITMRKAISYAVNYTYIFEIAGNNLVIRANSPISPGYGAAYNASVQAATYDLDYARQVLIDEGVAPPAAATWSDAQWRAASFGVYNYTYNSDNTVRADIGVLLTDWLDLIGIDIIDNSVPFDDFLIDLFVTPNELGLFWIGWGPDYVDPYNMLDPLFNPISFANSGQVDDAQLNAWMEAALSATNDTVRNNIYKTIQWYLAEVLYPHCFGYHPKITYVYSADLINYPHNAQGNLYFYPCQVPSPPTITINAPNNGESFSTSPPDYDIDINEPNLDSMWYTMDNGVHNITITSGTGILDETLWNALSDGSVTITFYANNTFGNIGNAQVTVFKDTIAPLVIINEPNNGDMFSTSPPDYDIDITEPNLDSMWYTMDNGVHNVTITSDTGIIDKTLWNALSDGSITITFYTNDSAGNIGNAQVLVYKDIIAPVIIINEPEMWDEYTETIPLYDIDITETNLDTTWYTMDNGIHNVTITSDAGMLDGTLWNALPYGVVTITFYAEDTAGNIGYSTVLVYKSEPIQGTQIPLIVTITVSVICGGAAIGLAIILLIRRKRKVIP